MLISNMNLHELKTVGLVTEWANFNRESTTNASMTFSNLSREVKLGNIFERIASSGTFSYPAMF